MTLKHKTIILISSESWGKIFISKHNYAIALAKRGNKVFFLNPIDTSLRPGEVKMTDSGVHPDLKVVTFRPFFPLALKFHLRPVFSLLIKWNIKVILRKLRIKPDIVWDFNWSYLYNDLSIFGAPLKIFNPVDQLAADACRKKADLVISISDDILEQYSLENVPKLRLNHGLGEVFALAAEKESPLRAKGNIQVGYVGNLTLDSLDRDLLLEIITGNPDVTFNLIGPLSGKGSNLGTTSDHDDIRGFVDKLQRQKNVILHGIKAQHEVPELLESYDILLLCYRRTVMFKCDNSHKMIEYLSSGKVVVSTNLSAYAGNELVTMSGKDLNQQLPALFRTVAGNLDKYNSLALQKERKAFALQNTYEGHIRKIEAFLQENHPTIN
ncbi:MAG TPA: hypothetical protein VL832_20965 [Puia sp.]|nr:hypothetical protein [Puia sp.]